jgi:hypothetical protein
MKLCPECKRTFDNELSFCLEDGTRLVDERSSNTTVIYPADTTIPSPKPTPTHFPEPVPTPAATSNKSLIAVMLGIVGTLLIVIVWGGIKIGIWYLDHNQNSHQNSNYNPSIANASPSPGPSYNPLSLITGSPSPTPSPTADPSVSPAPDEAKDVVITAGTYEWEGTRRLGENKQSTATLRMRVAIYGNGTYYQRVFLTIPERQIDNVLGMEEKGRFTQSGELLQLSARRGREIDFSTGQFQGWHVPEDGVTSQERVRNVTENSFELYDSSENDWFTFIRVINLGNLDR